MFGLGGTMSILYGQITTSKPVRIVSSTDGKTMYDFTMMIDIQQNSPVILSRIEKKARGRIGTKVEITLLGDYFRSIQKIQEYFRQTALVNPYGQLTYEDPKGAVLEFQRATREMPASSKETKPHPHGVDVETVRRLVRPEESKLVDCSPEVLGNRLDKELAVTMKRVTASSRFVSRTLGTAESEKVRKKPKIWTFGELLENLNGDTDGTTSVPDEVRVLRNVGQKWDSLSKPVKSFLSLLYQIPIDARKALGATNTSLDFVRLKLRSPEIQNGEEAPSLTPIEPFYDHLLRVSGGETMLRFMKNFHRVGTGNAEKFLTFARFDPNRPVRTLSNDELVSFVGALHKFDDFLMPDASCLSPLNETILEAGIRKELDPEFVAVTKRPASAYSGFPFIVEVGLAYGGKILNQGLKLLRFANRIPLLYDEGSDVSWKILNEEVDWRRYKIPQDAPLAIITHVCSTKVPYKTVGKEYLADRPELEKELKNGVRVVLRNLSSYLSRKGSMEMVQRKINIYGKYIPLIARFSTALSGAERLPRYDALLRKEETYTEAAENAVDKERREENEDVQRTLEEYD